MNKTPRLERRGQCSKGDPLSLLISYGWYLGYHYLPDGG